MIKYLPAGHEKTVVVQTYKEDGVLAQSAGLHAIWAIGSLHVSSQLEDASRPQDVQLFVALKMAEREESRKRAYACFGARIRGPPTRWVSHPSSTKFCRAVTAALVLTGALKW